MPITPPTGGIVDSAVLKLRPQAGYGSLRLFYPYHHGRHINSVLSFVPGRGSWIITGSGVQGYIDG